MCQVRCSLKWRCLLFIISFKLFSLCFRLAFDELKDANRLHLPTNETEGTRCTHFEQYSTNLWSEFLIQLSPLAYIYFIHTTILCYFLSVFVLLVKNGVHTTFLLFTNSVHTEMLSAVLFLTATSNYINICCPFVYQQYAKKKLSILVFEYNLFEC